MINQQSAVCFDQHCGNILTFVEIRLGDREDDSLLYYCEPAPYEDDPELETDLEDNNADAERQGRNDDAGFVLPFN